ncbi:MAG: hypothetical protein HFH09_05185 [Bacilli bacterium]|nr:hypothetical protein [Bacilli bacterium]
MKLGDAKLKRVFTFLIGFGFSTIGAVYIISYCNLMTVGYNFHEYVQFIIRRLECQYFLIGLCLIFLSIYTPGGRKYELHI